MKQSVLSILAAMAFCTTPALAQQQPATDPAIGLHLPTQKGSLTLGSNLLVGETGFGATNENYRIAGTYNVGISPRVGYFVMDNLMVGATLNANFYGENFDRTVANRGYNSQSVGLGVFARKYFGKAADKNGALHKLRFFVEAGVGHNRGWAQFNVDQNNVQHGTFNSTTLQVMPGVNYFLNRNVAFEAGLNYSRILQSQNVIGNSSNLRFNIGMQVFLRK